MIVDGFFAYLKIQGFTQFLLYLQAILFLYTIYMKKVCGDMNLGGLWIFINGFSWMNCFAPTELFLITISFLLPWRCAACLGDHLQEAVVLCEMWGMMLHGKQFPAILCDPLL